MPLLRDTFYKEPDRFALPFQIFMASTRIRMVQLQRATAQLQGKQNVFIDRNLLGDMVFEQTNHELGRIQVDLNDLG